MEQKSLKKNAFYSVLKVFLNLLFPLITFPYATRILQPEGIGKVNFANNIINFFIMIASLGIGTYATREAVKVRENKNELTKLFKEILYINLICCIIAYILFFISLNFIPKFSNYRSLLLLCSIKIFFSVLGFEWIFTANEEFKYITIRSFIIQIFSVIYLFIFVRDSSDLLHYTVFIITTTVGSNFFNIFFINKFIDIKIKTNIEIKKHLKAIIIFFGITVVTSIYTFLDTTMLGFLSTDVEVGYYTASTKIGHLVINMLTAITTVLFPRFTDYIQKNENTKFNDLIQKSINILFLLSIPMTFGIIILSKPLILFISGIQYLPSVTSMQIISPITIFITFGSLIGVQILPALGKEKISFYSYIAGALVNITLNFFLIPKKGAIGASIGTVFAEFTVTFIQSIYIRKSLIQKDIIITVIESLIASVIMTISIYFLLIIISKPLYQLIISFIVGISIYSLLLFLMKNNSLIYYFNKLVRKNKNS